MTEQHICPAPAGDTLTSRRLFDSLSAGCVPLVLRSWFLMSRKRYTFETGLPFPHAIAWGDIALRLAPAPPSKAACLAGDVEWLTWWLGGAGAGAALSWDPRGGRLAMMRQRGAEVFRAHLDYERNSAGVATALLAELAATHLTDSTGARPPTRTPPRRNADDPFVSALNHIKTVNTPTAAARLLRGLTNDHEA